MALPSQDLSARSGISVRLAQVTRHPDTLALAGPLSFGIALVDGAGTVVELSSTTPVPGPAPRNDPLSGLPGWANEYVTVRLDLTDFESADPALDRSDIQAVRLLFGPSHGSAAGFVALDDVLVE